MKRVTCTLAMTAAALLLIGTAACSGKSSGASNVSSGGVTIIKLGTTVNERDSFQVAAEKFAELIKERTGGSFVIDIYPNGSLGDERTMLESMQIGTLDMGIITSGPFVNFVPDMGVLDMPFLFASNEEVYKILDGEIGRTLLSKMEAANLKGLAYAERGFRNLTTSGRAVHGADDVKGLKLRVMENTVYISTFKALGVNTIPMAWAEALTALQQNTISGQENPVNVIHSFKLWETQGHVSMTRHAYASAILTMGLKKFNSLPADIQTIFLDAAQDAAEYQRAWIAENESQQMSDLEANGMVINREPDLTSFRSAVASVYDEYSSKYGEYINQINAALGR